MDRESYSTPNWSDFSYKCIDFWNHQSVQVSTVSKKRGFIDQLGAVAAERTTQKWKPHCIFKHYTSRTEFIHKY